MKLNLKLIFNINEKFSQKSFQSKKTSRIICEMGSYWEKVNLIRKIHLKAVKMNTILKNKIIVPFKM